MVERERVDSGDSLLITLLERYRGFMPDVGGQVCAFVSWLKSAVPPIVFIDSDQWTDLATIGLTGGVYFLGLDALHIDFNSKKFDSQSGVAQYLVLAKYRQSQTIHCLQLGPLTTSSLSVKLTPHHTACLYHHRVVGAGINDLSWEAVRGKGIIWPLANQVILFTDDCQLTVASPKISLRPTQAQAIVLGMGALPPDDSYLIPRAIIEVSAATAV